MDQTVRAGKNFNERAEVGKFSYRLYINLADLGAMML
jgi:hypothetical protein